MKNSNAERQKRYRERALKDPDGLLLTRLQVMISPQADGSLDRLCKSTGKPKRELVEEALIELEKRYSVTESFSLSYDENFWADMIKGYAGQNTPEKMKRMFQHLMDKRPTTAQDARKEMCVALDVKSVPLKFLEKGLNKLVDMGLIVWDGELKEKVTWL